MNLLSWIILLAVAAWFVAAIVHMKRRKGGCACCEDQHSCGGSCSGCSKCGKK